MSNQTFEEWWHEAFIQQNSFNDIRQSAKAAWDHQKKIIDERDAFIHKTQYGRSGEAFKEAQQLLGDDLGVTEKVDY